MAARPHFALVTTLTLGVMGCTSTVSEPPRPTVDAAPADAGAPGPDGITALDLSMTRSNHLALALAVLCDGPAYGACTAPWTCGCDVHGLIAGAPPTDLERCIAGRRTLCEARVGAAVRRGLGEGWRIDARAAAACVAARRHLYDLCLPPDEAAPPACLDAILTAGAIGEPCDEEGLRCAGGAGVCEGGRCIAVPAEGEACGMRCAVGMVCAGGVCRAPVPAGGACRDHGDCASPEPCIAGRCGAPAKVGDPCTDQAECEALATCVAGRCARVPPACTDDVACGAAGACERLPFHTCSARAEAGDRCDDDRMCPLGLVCVRERLDRPGRCDRLPRWDEPCSGPCEEGLHCFYTDGTRERARCQPARQAGETCDPEALDGRACADDLACLDGRCGPVPQAGEPCGELGECAADAVCDPRIGMCIATVIEGDACPVGIECAAPLACRDGVCRAPAGAGEPCGVCEAGLDCRFDVGAGHFTCQALAGVGEECGSRCDDAAWCVVDVRSCIPAVCRAVLPGRY